MCCLACDDGVTRPLTFKRVSGTWSVRQARQRDVRVCVLQFPVFYLFACVCGRAKIRYYYMHSGYSKATHTPYYNRCNACIQVGSHRSRRGSRALIGWHTPNPAADLGVSRSGLPLLLTILCPMSHIQRILIYPVPITVVTEFA